MGTFNMTREMADEYYRATDGGAHPPDPAKMSPLARNLFESTAVQWTRIGQVTTVTQSCALCSELIDLSCCTPDTYEATMAAHHAVCPARPIEVGDYVRWSRTTYDLWIEGELIEISPDGSNVHIRVRAQGGIRPITTIDTVQRCDGLMWKSVVINRILRPTEAQRPKVGDIIPLETGALAVRYQQLIHIFACTPDSRMRLKLKAAERAVFLPLTVGEHSDGDVHARVSRRGGDMLVEVFSSVRDWCWTVTTAAPPAPVLVDDLDREQCLARWMENRLAVEGRCAPPNVLTRTQIDVARALWLERFGAQRSAALRAKVAAGEADRNQVRVDLEVDPWD